MDTSPVPLVSVASGASFTTFAFTTCVGSCLQAQKPVSAGICQTYDPVLSRSHSHSRSRTSAVT